MSTQTFPKIIPAVSGICTTANRPVSQFKYSMSFTASSVTPVYSPDSPDFLNVSKTAVQRLEGGFLINKPSHRPRGDKLRTCPSSGCSPKAFLKFHKP